MAEDRPYRANAGQLALRLVGHGTEPDRHVLPPTTPASFIVGRVRSADITLFASTVARNHCRFVFESGRLFVEDLQSTTGTIVGGRRVAREELYEGDVIELGDRRIEVVRLTV